MKEIVLNIKSMPYGAMVWWQKRDEDEIAAYTVKLYIGNSASDCTEICSVDKDRHTLYHTFSGLANLGISSYYYVAVEAENHSGETVAKSSIRYLEVQDSVKDIVDAIKSSGKGHVVI